MGACWNPNSLRFILNLNTKRSRTQLGSLPDNTRFLVFLSLDHHHCAADCTACGWVLDCTACGWVYRFQAIAGRVKER